MISRILIAAVLSFAATCMRAAPAPGTALNENPNFESVSDSVPGWRISWPARLARDAEGVQYVLADEGKATSDLFPVTGGSTLVVTIKARGPRFLKKRLKAWAAVAFFDDEEDAKSQDARWRFSRPKIEIGRSWKDERTESYLVPKTAKLCRITLRRGGFYSCEVREVPADSRDGAKDGGAR